MTKCRCVHNVPWFVACLDCLQDRESSGWTADSWDGFRAVRVGRAQRSLRSDTPDFWMMTDWLTRAGAPMSCQVLD